VLSHSHLDPNLALIRLQLGMCYHIPIAAQTVCVFVTTRLLAWAELRTDARRASRSSDRDPPRRVTQRQPYTGTLKPVLDREPEGLKP
jgi:hypothetical protein